MVIPLFKAHCKVRGSMDWCWRLGLELARRNIHAARGVASVVSSFVEFQAAEVP